MAIDSVFFENYKVIILLGQTLTFGWVITMVTVHDVAMVTVHDRLCPEAHLCRKGA